MSIDTTLQIIQHAYPQVYLACHTRHQRKKSTAYRLSARDSSILAHLDAKRPMVPQDLADHLNISRSTLSEAVKRLASLGFVEQVPRRSIEGRRGGMNLLLSAKGLEAIHETSVLEPARLREVLSRLSASDLKVVARGMTLLASACIATGNEQRAAE